MKKLTKLKKGDKVAIVSPSFAAPAVWPQVHELGLKRIRKVFELEPVEYPATAKLDATVEEKAADLVAAYSDPEIKAVISTLGGDIQVTYIKNLPSEMFVNNPKPFLGFSDCSHFSNFLF
ncbi:LD-carboxypeptidase, partial [bacterium]|nr:LD-carboxypeptidase [bacterium]